ncbi:Druantia anti-phage system protein DruA [Peristeroidobacter soli]|uniref:Druantia anti-phage system protein DruA n=1 Tax=Peristeroidobacter soli TaxID=2497877 RepID=UPI001C37D111|nr:Druantia anti-phage system protein DruA [Peristeroidobacter soli]
MNKEGYRDLHMPQREERLESEAAFLEAHGSSLIDNFAYGGTIDVNRMQIRLELIDSGTWQSNLFRFATLLWSIPVSYGFGRRMRYLVWDDYTEKLVGLFALGDPVFNLRARDRLIGWSSDDRGERLVHIMDGYVVGAVPPFNRLLGGKLIASLMRTREVVDTFRQRYGSSEGIISGNAKNAHLVAITTTSALGKSSVYNRLKLNGVEYLSSIGVTDGYGHFHFPRELFEEMRAYLGAKKDPYANNHQYGDGPNWRLRTIRRALTLLDMDPDLVRHGLAREVFFGHVADNAFDVLRGKRKHPKYDSLLTAAEVATQSIERWMKPRAMRDSSFSKITHADILNQIHSSMSVIPGPVLHNRG